MTKLDGFDVAVVGGGPAGACAATLLAQREYNVALVGQAGVSDQRGTMGWLNARTAPLLAQLGVPQSPLFDQVVSDVVFHSGDFEKTATPAFESPPAYVVDRGLLVDAMTKAARDAGVTVLADHAVADVIVGEDSVSLDLGGDQTVTGRLLVFAAGQGSDLVDRLGIPQERSRSPIRMAHAEGEVPSGSEAKASKIDIVLGLDKIGSFGVCCLAGNRASVSIHWRGEREEAATAFVDLCRQVHAREIVPVDLTQEAAATEPVPSPAGVALDMDSHVGKHALLIGEAGGFVAALSDEGILPAMWSAQMAVEVIAEALGSVHSQDELMAFNSRWRIDMADYLRSPHTDIQFLLPLIFSNQPMADRMGAAFFGGENI